MVTRFLALYPAAVAAFLIVVPILQPRTGPLALANILSVHLALAALVLAPVAMARRGVALRSSLAILGFVAVLRFGGEWFSLPPSADPTDDLFMASSWNLEAGARSGAGAVEGISTLDSDIVALQELGPDHVRAITESATLAERWPEQALYPDAGVFGMGLLSRWPILRAELHGDPSLIEAVIDAGGQAITVITAHPLAGRISMLGPVPIALGSENRDQALERIRARIDAAIAREETVVVLGDFNVAPTEPAFKDLVDGLRDAHGEVGQGPGWTWRPSRFEAFGIGLLRIDLAIGSPDLAPVSVVEHCGRIGDHCILEAHFSLESVRDGDATFDVVLPGNDTIRPLPVSVVDTTGLVLDADAAGPGGEDGVVSVLGHPERLRFGWTGGECEESTLIRVDRAGTGLQVTIREVYDPPQGGCILIGLGRQIELAFSDAIDPARIVLKRE